jgi:UDP-N-acetylmuramoylalanine--D-glutamate ligase
MFDHSLIFGFARSGKAVYHFLKNKGFHVWVYDQSYKNSDSPDIVSHSDHIPWDKIRLLIQSPGIPLDHPITHTARRLGIPIRSDLDVFDTYRDSTAVVIGVTGTNGKSTTTALIQHIMSFAGYDAMYGGNSGAPALHLLMDASNASDIKPKAYIIELSSYQLESIGKIALDVAVWLNITEDHLDRHKTMNAYVQAKKRIFLHAQNAVISVDDPYSKNVYETVSVQQPCISFSMAHVGKSMYYIHDTILFENELECFKCIDISPLKGMHNQHNCLAAFAACRQMGISASVIEQALSTFKGLPHRIETVYEDEQLIIINDSKATNADSTECALACFADMPIFWIAGGKPKMGGIQSLKPYFPRIKIAYFIGEAQHDFHFTGKSLLASHCCDTLICALQKAYADARKETEKAVILFSPACASFDQFKDFEDRGNQFKAYVLEVIR